MRNKTRSYVMRFIDEFVTQRDTHIHSHVIHVVNVPRQNTENIYISTRNCFVSLKTHQLIRLKCAGGALSYLPKFFMGFYLWACNDCVFAYLKNKLKISRVFRSFMFCLINCLHKYVCFIFTSVNI